VRGAPARRAEDADRLDLGKEAEMDQTQMTIDLGREAEMNQTQMTTRDREDLAKLVRRAEKVAKADADRLAAERLADFEQQMAARYAPEDDEVWRQLHADAQSAISEAEARIAESCRELGIPEQLRPGLGLYWHGRGENAVRERRAELCLAAKSRIDALARAAKAEIERRSVDVQTRLVAGGLESEEAKAFLASMPTAEALMPAAPALSEIEAAAPPRTGF
jgi:hypothetical protein